MAAFDGWAVVELLGHRVRYGRASEVTMVGEAMLKIEIPTDPPTVEYYSGKALYGIRPASEESIRAYHAPRKLLATAPAPGDDGADIDVDEFDADTGGQHDDEPDDVERRCGGCRMSIKPGDPTADVQVDEDGSETWHEDCAKANAERVADPVGSDRPRGDL